MQAPHSLLHVGESTRHNSSIYCQEQWLGIPWITSHRSSGGSTIRSLTARICPRILTMPSSKHKGEGRGAGNRDILYESSRSIPARRNRSFVHFSASDSRTADSWNIIPLDHCLTSFEIDCAFPELHNPCFVYPRFKTHFRVSVSCIE